MLTTMTFGAHRGADQGAGRVTSGRDLLRQLRGSTSASPPSTAGLLQLPGLTSTRPGRHSVVPDLHQHFWAGIFFLGLAYLCPSQHIYVPADICGAGVDSDISLADIYNFLAGTHVSVPDYFNFGLFWPEHAISGPAQQNPSRPGPA
jgi:hypothetical protein